MLEAAVRDEAFNAPAKDVAVEAPPEKHHALYLIDKASPRTLGFFALAIVGFLVLHVLIALRVPPQHPVRDRVLPITKTDSIETVEVNLRLREFLPAHSLITLNASLVLQEPRARPLAIHWEFRTYEQFRGGKIDRTQKQMTAATLLFPPGQRTSESFCVGQWSASDLDGANVRLILIGNLTGATGVRFLWTFSSDAEPLRTYAHLFLAAIVTYMNGVFLYSFRTTRDVDVQYLLIFIGCFGSLAGNPLKLIGMKTPTGHFFDALLMSIFFILYRFFLFVQLHLLRSQRRSLHWCEKATLLLLFLFFVVVDGFANLEDSQMREWRPGTNGNRPFSKIRAWGHVVFYAVLVLLLIAVIVQDDPGSTRRVGLLAISMLLSAAATIIVQVVFVLTKSCEGSIVPEYWIHAVHATLAALTLFLMQPGNSHVYKGLGDAGKVPGSLGIEQQSDGQGDGFIVREEGV